jgi:hypothetical protein
MTHLSASYAMVGVGIAAAIGFVFALSLISPSIRGGTGGLTENPPGEQSEQSTFSLKQQQNLPQPLAGDNNNNTTGESQNIPSAPNGEGASSSMLAGMINQSNIRPTLASVVALKSTGERISKITDGMHFKQGVPIFIQANLENQNPAATVSNHSIIIGIKGTEGTRVSQIVATFRGDISPNSNVSIECYWQPTGTGKYIVSVFSMTPEDLTLTVPAQPVVAIPVVVVQ